MAGDSLEQEIAKILKNTSQEIQQIIGEVLELEESKLYQKKPWGVKDDIERIIQRVIAG